MGAIFLRYVDGTGGGKGVRFAVMENYFPALWDRYERDEIFRNN